MAAIDIILIVVYFIFSIGIALFISKRSGKNIEEFFLSGRKLPWWLAGTTMVATTFAADTPLAVTELVVKNGIAGNWFWWNMMAGNMLTVFFFAKLWRRSEILTDVEFIELRYSGKPAAFLRGFKALYLGLFINIIIMGWVNLALATIFKVIFGISDDSVFYWIVASMTIVGIYSAISGLWGVALTDMFQFVIAMIGCIVLAVVVLQVPEIGGISGLKKALPAHVFNFFPSITFDASTVAAGIMSISFSAFIAHIFIQWWSSWYPGSEPGGGGYVAQRMMSTIDERHSLLSTLWFTIAHYALRPWPWIIVALASLVLYPNIENAREGYVMAMKDHLPPGLFGLLIAAFLAAYMSTISSQLNWGCSYIINDFYKRFIQKNATPKHYVLISRVATIIMVILSSLAMKVMGSITGAWEFIIESGAGLGLVLILRWYWWRINAWSEIAAILSPFFGYAICKFTLNLAFPHSLYFIVAFTTLSWLIATFVSKPTDMTVLKNFFIKVYPGGPGWKKISATVSGMTLHPEPLTGLFINWIIGIILVYSLLFSIGKIIFQEYLSGGVLLGISIILFILLNRRLIKK